MWRTSCESSSLSAQTAKKAAAKIETTLQWENAAGIIKKAQAEIATRITAAPCFRTIACDCAKFEAVIYFYLTAGPI